VDDKVFQAMARRVSIINFKGGVGKTTLAFQLAAGLARFHASRVLLVDMDHQSSLSIVCLTAQNWASAVQRRKTVNEIFTPFIGQSNAFPDRSIIEQRAVKRVRNNHYDRLDILPASLGLDDVEIELTASTHGNPIYSEWDKRTLVCRWIEETGIDDDYDYIIFDCPPATKIVSQNAIAASHGYIIPVVPESVMERGAPHLVGMIQNGIDAKLNMLAQFGAARSMHVPNTALVGVVVTRIRTHGPAQSGYTDDHTQHLASLQRRWSNLLINPLIEEGTGVSQALAQGVPVYEMDNTQNVGERNIHTMYHQLTDNLQPLI